MPNRAPLDAKTARWLPWVVAIAFFMQSLDGTILNTALPAMARDLAENPLRMQGVIIAYMLTVALLIPASGWIADRFGTKRIFFSAILLFSFGSLLCAAANSLGFLIFARVVQGLGGALMLPVGRLVVLRAYPRSELVRIMSFITIPGLLGPLLGPTVGGWLVEILSWHWIFLLNLPVGLLGCIAVWKFIPDLRGAERTTFDGPGFLLFGAAMVLITIAMEGLGELHLRMLLERNRLLVDAVTPELDYLVSRQGKAGIIILGDAQANVLAIEGQVTPMLGMWMLTKGLVAAMLGGLGSVRGVLLGGWLLGIVEAHAQAAFGAVGREFATYALLFLVLVASPAGRSGLLGRGGWRHAA